jgi:hypothetical protein
MAAFEAKEAAEAEARERAEGKADDDGFILVTKKAKAKPFESDHQKNKRKKLEQGGAGMQLAPLYRFQLRESKRNRTWSLTLHACFETPSPTACDVASPIRRCVLHALLLCMKHHAIIRRHRDACVSRFSIAAYVTSCFAVCL